MEIKNIQYKQIKKGDVINPNVFKDGGDYELFGIDNYKYTGYYKNKPNELFDGIKTVKVASDPDAEGLFSVVPYNLEPVLNAYKQHQTIEVKPERLTRNGLVVSYNEHTIFVPNKQLLITGSREKASYLTKNKISIQLIKAEKGKDKDTLIGSERIEDLDAKRAQREAENKEFSAYINSLKDKDQEIEAKVVAIKDYGVFLEAEEFKGRRALLHKSEISIKDISLNDLKKKYPENAALHVKILSYNKGRISLTIAYRSFAPEYAELRKAGFLVAEVDGWVDDLGAFLKPVGYQATGLLHFKNLNDEQFIDGFKPDKKGLLTKARVSYIDKETGRISFSQYSKRRK